MKVPRKDAALSDNIFDDVHAALEERAHGAVSKQAAAAEVADHPRGRFIFKERLQLLELTIARHTTKWRELSAFKQRACNGPESKRTKPRRCGASWPRRILEKLQFSVCRDERKFSDMLPCMFAFAR